MRMRVGFTKTVYGEAIVTGKTKRECKENFENGDWDEEFDNKSDYTFDEEEYWNFEAEK